MFNQQLEILGLVNQSRHTATSEPNISNT